MTGRRLAAALVAVALLLLGAGAAVATSAPSLRGDGPTSVTGTPATGVFEIGDRTIRQVRYVDRSTLRYSFRLVNDAALPVTVDGIVAPEHEPRLFQHVRVAGPEGTERFTVPARGDVPVELQLLMTGCESLSARAGSFVTEVTLAVSGPLGMNDRTVTVRLPEEVRAGSPREAGCANATATSRPPG